MAEKKSKVVWLTLSFKNTTLPFCYLVSSLCQWVIISKRIKQLYSLLSFLDGMTLDNTLSFLVGIESSDIVCGVVTLLSWHQGWSCRSRIQIRAQTPHPHTHTPAVPSYQQPTGVNLENHTTTTTNTTATTRRYQTTIRRRSQIKSQSCMLALSRFFEFYFSPMEEFPDLERYGFSLGSKLRC